MEPQRAHKRPRSQSPASPPQQRQPAVTTSDPSRIWLPDIVQRFAVSLTPNEVACALRLVNKATAAQFSAAQHTTVRLSQPVPHRAFLWRWAGPDAMRTLAWRQRLELPRLTARSGSIANLEVLLARDELPPIPDHQVFGAAAAAGQLDVCVWLRERGCAWQEGDALTAAAGGGQQAVCEWLLVNGCPEMDTYSDATAAAAWGGHVGLMDWLLLRADSIIVDALVKGAAVGCDLLTLQRLHHAHVDTLPGGLPAQCKPVIISAAAGSPTADWQAKVEWLEARGYPRAIGACKAAAARPDALPRLQWLRQRRYPLDRDVAEDAAEVGNVEALQYVLSQGIEVHPGMMRRAARGGHMAIMEVLHARGVPVDEETVKTAAEAGHLPAVAWLVERLGAAAARAGSMELLRWLRAWGCPWDDGVFAAVAGGGSEEQLEWLAEQGCPMGDEGWPYVRTADQDDLAMLRCLRRMGCPWGPESTTFTRAVLGFTNTGEPVQRMLGLLLDQGCPVDWDAAEEAAQLHQSDEGVELMEWLWAQREQRAPVDSGEA
ncbi:Ankyrin repeat domain-containing protein [Tetrabaena socialis]|uniref:Ankyrin repeat domain-containing protein n=1 Tax=Tetrabaena socialis TaxID=47790 RepID=A0A2J8A771_9CHLO|nr:Ankyrin repeat domain-containing protein [Tetrabaena socialis]|eukprot:PNH08368.1 Ankyrin repeat domain-containing protein [Tetrabaena socialis]